MVDHLRSDKRRQVQILRGLAVFLVVIFHFTKLLPSGFAGVDIFFVISGFVLSIQFEKLYTQVQSFKSIQNALKSFWRARFLRLFPAYLLVIALTLLGLVMLADKKTIGIAVKQSLATTFGIGNIASYSLSGDYFNPEPNTLLHLWSLSAEIQIYLSICIAAIICGLLRISLKAVLLALAIISFIANLLSLDFVFYQFLGVNNPEMFQYYSPISHSWQFILGILAANYRARSKLRLHLHSVLFPLTLFALLLLSTLPPSKFVLVFCTFATSALLIVDFKQKENFIMRCLEWLGDRSYSVYLIHLPLFYLVKFFYISFGIDENFIHVITSLLLLILSSHHCYLRVEQKYREKSQTSAKSKVGSIRGIFVVVVGLSSFLLVNNNSENEVEVFAINGSSQIAQCSSESNGNFQICGDKESKKRILVVGDSHAGALGEAVLEAFGDQGFEVRISVAQSCPFVLPGASHHDSLCSMRNAEIKNYLMQTRFDVIYSTFRNPNFDHWTPGSTRPKEYLGKNLKSGINFLSSSADQHYLFLPNSELTSLTWLRSQVAPKFRIRSFSSDSFKHETNNMQSVTPVLTDSAICAQKFCTFTELSGFLGHDGNHLNSKAAARLSDYLALQRS